MKIVVTGGTGFLGSHLVSRLREGYENVSVVSRSLGYDISIPRTLEEPFENADVVFHLAALVQSRPGAFTVVNVHGLQNVLRLSAEAGIRKLICVSSFTVFGPSHGEPHEETSAETRKDFFHGYDASKYEAFQTARSWKEKLPLNIVFPTVIYGPGPLTEGNIMAHLFRRWLRLRLAPLPLGGSPSWNFVFVGDVVDGLMKILVAPAGEDYILGGRDCSLRELAETLRDVSGRSIVPVGLSGFLFKASSYLEDWGARIGKFTPLVLPSTAEFFMNDWQFSSGKASRELGYEPRPLETGLKSTYEWMKEAKLV
jgi:farnesol dehydrogenase